MVVLKFALGPYDPLGHRCFRYHERRGDLGRRESGQEPQDKADLGVSGQGRVSAQEHEPQLVVSADIHEIVEPVKFRIVVRFHAVDLESVSSEVPLAAGLR